MLHGYKIGSCSRRCSVSGRLLAHGERYFSALVEEGNEVLRIDVAPEHWTEAPDHAIGWWRSQLANPKRGKSLAPNEVLLQLFDRWTEDPAKQSIRYVLALLLIRRKVLRMERQNLLSLNDGESSSAILRVYSPLTDESYEVLETRLSSEEAQKLDCQLIELVHADAA